jgi:Flp pilus assembly protein TadD
MHPKIRERPEIEVDFYESLLKRLPADVDTLKLLAEAYTASGRVRDGLEVDFKLRSLCPNDGYVYYNLACSLSLCGQVDEALTTLKEAVRLGYGDWKWIIKDPDLRIVRSDPRFDIEIKPLFAKKV